MSWQDDLRVLIESKFQAEWTLTTNDLISYGLNPEGFKPPENGETPWVKIYFTILDNQNAEIGTRFQRARGILTLKCFTKLDSGEKLSNDMCDEFGKIFQNKNFNGIQMFVMTPLKLGAIGNWYQQNAKIDFTYDVFS